MIKMYTLEPFAERISVRNVMYVSRKAVAGDLTGVAETTLYRFGSSS